MSSGGPSLAAAAAANGSVGPGSPPLEELSEEEDEEEDSIEGSPEYFKRRAKQVRASGFFRPMAAAALPQLFHSRTQDAVAAPSLVPKERKETPPDGQPELKSNYVKRCASYPPLPRACVGLSVRLTWERRGRQTATLAGRCARRGPE